MLNNAAPAVTIIVPTYNRQKELRVTVEQLQRQPFHDFELWIIDQSDPAIAEANAQFVKFCGDQRLHYLHLKVKGLPNARNEGLARARGQFVLFVDDDVILLSDDFLGAHIRCYADPSVGGVTGRHVERYLYMNARHTACHVSWGGRTIFNLFGTVQQEIASCKGSNMSFRMAAVHMVGGFDRKTQLLEDTDFSTRVRVAGWRLLFEPEAEILHLSTPAGGVREKNALETECRRFSSTAYYILKHRGLLGVPSFLATFTLIALMRAGRFHSLAVLPRLCGAILSGFTLATAGPDQLLPILSESKEL